MPDLRHDILVPFTEAHNNIVFVSRTTPNPGAGGITGGGNQVRKLRRLRGSQIAPPFTGITGSRGSAFLTRSEPQDGGAGWLYLSFLNGGAYEYGTSFAASFMSNCRTLRSFAPSTGSSTPGYGNWDAQTLPYPQQLPFSPTLGNARRHFRFPH